MTVPKRRRNRKSSNPWLDPKVWDFRSLTREELVYAAPYEYALSSTSILELWSQWLCSTVFVNRPEGERTVVVKDAFAAYPFGLPAKISGDPVSRDPVVQALLGSFPHQLRHIGLDGMLLRAPFFPTPWLGLNEKQKEALMRSPNAARTWPAFCEVENVPGLPNPPQVTSPFHADLTKGAPALEGEFRAWLANQRRVLSQNGDTSIAFQVVVDFGRPSGEIQSDFADWLRNKRDLLQEQKVIPERDPAPPEVKPVVMTWLGAYRLRQAGYSFEEAKLEVQHQIDTCKLKSVGPCSLPKTKDPSAWTDWANHGADLVRQFPFAGLGLSRFPAVW